MNATLCLGESLTTFPSWNQETFGVGSAVIRHSKSSRFPSSSCLIAGFFANVGAIPSICLQYTWRSLLNTPKNILNYEITHFNREQDGKGFKGFKELESKIQKIKWPVSWVYERGPFIGFVCVTHTKIADIPRPAIFVGVRSTLELSFNIVNITPRNSTRVASNSRCRNGHIVCWSNFIKY